MMKVLVGILPRRVVIVDRVTGTPNDVVPLATRNNCARVHASVSVSTSIGPQQYAVRCLGDARPRSLRVAKWPSTYLSA